MAVTTGTEMTISAITTTTLTVLRNTTRKAHTGTGIETLCKLRNAKSTAHKFRSFASDKHIIHNLKGVTTMSYKPNFSDAPEWKDFTLNRKQSSAKGG